MKPRIAIAAIAAALWAGHTPAQDMQQGIPPNVLDAIREFNERPPAAEEEAAADIDDVVASILAGEPPAADAGESQPAADDGAPLPDGPLLRVQSLRDTGGQRVDAGEIRITAPFAAKPIGRPSAGWKLVTSPDAPAFVENVEVAPGTWLELSIRPHVLVPDADGRSVFQIPEPGFDTAHGYKQAATISSAIASSLDQLEADARVLGEVSDELEQILISLPKPAILSPGTEENQETEE